MPTKTVLPFIVLGQNLPISLTAALFIIHLHLHAPDLASAEPPSLPARPQRRKPASLTLPTLLLNAICLALPRLKTHHSFTALLLASRALLALPHTGLVNVEKREVQRSIAISGGFVVANLAVLRRSVSVGSVLGALVGRGGAVKAMGWDAVVGTVVYGALSWGGGV